MKTIHKIGTSKTIISAMMLTLMCGVALAAGQSDTFTQLDSNKDNYIDVKEAAVSAELTKLFTAADTDQDSKLSAAEFDKMLNAPAG